MTDLLGSGRANSYSHPGSSSYFDESYSHPDSSSYFDEMPDEKRSEKSDTEGNREGSDEKDTAPWIPYYPPWIPDYDFYVKKFSIPEKSAWVSSWFDVCDSRIDSFYDEAIKWYFSCEASNDPGRKFVIQVGSYCGEDKNPGYGAIICDNRCKPIIAESKVLPEGERVSPFYHELQGVNLGLELAIHYGLLNFRFDCTSRDMVRFLEDCLLRRKKCPSCLHCKGRSEIDFDLCVICFRSRLPVHQKANEERIIPVIQDFITKVHTLERRGLPCHLLSFTADSRKIKVADWLAKLGLSKKMRPHEIQENVELTELLFSEAVRLHKSLGYIF